MLFILSTNGDPWETDVGERGVLGWSGPVLVRSHLLTLKWWFMAPGELSWSLSPLQVKIKYSFIPRDMLLIIKCQLRSQKATRACPAGERERERERELQQELLHNGGSRASPWTSRMGGHVLALAARVKSHTSRKSDSGGKSQGSHRLVVMRSLRPAPVSA